MAKYEKISKRKTTRRKNGRRILGDSLHGCHVALECVSGSWGQGLALGGRVGPSEEDVGGEATAIALSAEGENRGREERGEGRDGIGEREEGGGKRRRGGGVRWKRRGKKRNGNRWRGSEKTTRQFQ